ncbi:MAG: CbiX/SirB N-terminal domain-containing protein [Gammaproteobacteria bacterium]|nr:CbiX/SirB N-terminal domain-containing protein [Gammaproteobacteria bacterium]
MADHSHLLLVAHGSRRQNANQEVAELCQRLTTSVEFDEVNAAFLELAEPSIADAIDQAVVAGATRVVILPYFLSEGRHVSEDVATLVAAAQARHDACDITMTPYLGQSPAIADVVQAILRESAQSENEPKQVKRKIRVVGLRSVADSDFPKTCRNCQRSYQTLSEFIRDTVSTTPETGLKQGFNDEEQAIVELLRNCQCGSILMSPVHSRRGNSDLASECREQFDQLVAQMAATGRTHESAREDLRQVITGGYGDILEQLKKISRPRRPS